MKETDKEFVERVALDVQVHGDIYGFDRPRLVTLASRGAETADEIERLRAALRDIIADSFSLYAIDVARTALKEDVDEK